MTRGVPAHRPALLLAVLTAWCLCVAVCVSARASEGGGYYDYEKEDLPQSPYSEATKAVKNVPIGAGFTWTMAGEMQTRAQSLDNRRDFSFDSNDEDFQVQQRTRLSFEFRHGPEFRAFFQGQDAHILWKDDTGPTNHAEENEFDLYQGYFEFNLMPDIADKPVVRLRLGRQEYKMGHEYILGDKDWFVGGQSFDMALLTWRPEAFEIDYFYARPLKRQFRQFDTWTGAQFAGSRLTAVGIKDHKIEGYAIYKWNESDEFLGEGGSIGDEKIWILGATAYGRFATWWDYRTETTVNVGRRGDDQMTGWRTDAYVGRTIAFGWRTLRLGGAYTLASGDHDPTDGVQGTFESLYPDPFLFHGKLLVAAGVNLQDVAFRSTARLWRGGQIDFDYHHLTLHQSKGPLVDAGRFAVSRFDPTGRAGKKVGHAIDLHVRHKFHENLELHGGVFLHLPDRYFRNTGNGGDELSRNYFMMLKVSF